MAFPYSRSDENQNSMHILSPPSFGQAENDSYAFSRWCSDIHRPSQSGSRTSRLPVLPYANQDNDICSGQSSIHNFNPNQEHHQHWTTGSGTTYLDNHAGLQLGFGSSGYHFDANSRALCLEDTNGIQDLTIPSFQTGSFGNTLPLDDYSTPPQAGLQAPIRLTEPAFARFTPSIPDVAPQPIMPAASQPNTKRINCTHSGCLATFGRGAEFRRHLRTVHDHSGGSDYRCMKCSYTSPRFDKVQSHMEKIHGLKVQKI